MSVLKATVIVIAAMSLSACSKAPRKVEGSFAISLVQTQITGLLSTADAGLGSSRLLRVHPSAVASGSRTNYWVENTQLLSAADLFSAEVHLSDAVKLTRSEFEQAARKYGRDESGMTNLSYAKWLKDNAQSRPEVVLTFTDAGKFKFADATRRHTGRQLAIIVDQEIITAPLIREEITGGVAVVSGLFTVDEAHAIVDRIHGRK